MTTTRDPSGASSLSKHPERSRRDRLSTKYGAWRICEIARMTVLKTTKEALHKSQ
jgi:hypothetical protein